MNLNNKAEEAAEMFLKNVAKRSFQETAMEQDLGC